MYIIGIMGALISNENMGCVALTYSLLKMLEDISQERDMKISYTVFEYEKDEERYRLLSENLGIELDRIQYAPIGFFNTRNKKLLIKKTAINICVLKEIKKCDLVIDLTQGDSFTDIYGMDRFESLTNVKRLVQHFNIPLILGPQTYGPFMDDAAKAKAKKVIENATAVISRDQESKAFLGEFCNKPVTVTTDLAFGLPYVRDGQPYDKVRVGINPSGLLVKSKTERTDLQTGLKADYDEYMDKLITALAEDDRYEVHLIPHVGDDAVMQYQDVPNVIAHKAFKTPVEAKNCIAAMDVFIGARMHATIGAFSAGVATIPTAYSRKFSGLFKNIGYDHVLDMTVLSTEEILTQTLTMIATYKDLQNEVAACMKDIQSKLNMLKDTLGGAIIRSMDGNQCNCKEK